MVRAGGVKVSILKNRNLKRIALSAAVILGVAICLWAFWHFDPFGLFAPAVPEKPLVEGGELQGYPWEEYKGGGGGGNEEMPADVREHLKGRIEELDRQAKKYAGELLSLAKEPKITLEMGNRLKSIRAELDGYQKELSMGKENSDTLAIEGSIARIENGLNGIGTKIEQLKQDIETLKSQKPVFPPETPPSEKVSPETETQKQEQPTTEGDETKTEEPPGNNTEKTEDNKDSQIPNPFVNLPGGGE